MMLFIAVYVLILASYDSVTFYVLFLFLLLLCVGTSFLFANVCKRARCVLFFVGYDVVCVCESRTVFLFSRPLLA